MTNTATLDTRESANQIGRIADAGADIVRLTAQGVNHARNLGEISKTVRLRGYDIPLVADIHFNRAAAFEAALHVEKVRINPGNFADPGRTFKKLEYTDEEYADEIKRIEGTFVPFIELCKQRGVAMRIGVNHGSLSDRIMSRYGDTPAGMVESALEFLRIAVAHQFYNIVISIKASNVVVMVETVKRLAHAMAEEGMSFPLHLGVTEAGDGEDGRVKSAVGIGSLLVDGIGDTIRVSLSEAPENEIPVAQMLVDHISRIAYADSEHGGGEFVMPPIANGRRRSRAVQNIGGDNIPVAVGVDFDGENIPAGVKVVAFDGDNAVFKARRYMVSLTGDEPVILKISYPSAMTRDEITIAASVDMGTLLLDGYADGIWIDAPSMSAEDRASLSLAILQATRLRISKTEYIACPGCGRTLFDLQGVLAEVKAATSHLKHLKIGVMGCIVNGPGEMADADYGYVGAAAGHVSLYHGRECVVKNIPAEQAITSLIDLIKANGDWHDAE
jgi:(E)-4-hydroxy-3-methylbut-2-enyl-diphosphate synthase